LCERARATGALREIALCMIGGEKTSSKPTTHILRTYAIQSYPCNYRIEWNDGIRKMGTGAEEHKIPQAMTTRGVTGRGAHRVREARRVDLYTDNGGIIKRVNQGARRHNIPAGAIQSGT
jgi:hypothetical protein